MNRILIKSKSLNKLAFFRFETKPLLIGGVDYRFSELQILGRFEESFFWFWSIWWQPNCSVCLSISLNSLLHHFGRNRTNISCNTLVNNLKFPVYECFVHMASQIVNFKFGSLGSLFNCY